MSKHAFFEVQPIPEITDAIDKFIGMCEHMCAVGFC